MLVEPNWGAFSAKFNGKEQKAFEWFCSSAAAGRLVRYWGDWGCLGSLFCSGWQRFCCSRLL